LENSSHKGNIELWFVSPIYYEDNILSDCEIKNLLADCYEIKKTIPSNHKRWRSELYTSFKNHNATKDPKFKPLLDKITNSVNAFARSLGSDYNYTSHEGWINISDSNHYQEFHYHTNSIFSVIYYLQAPEGSGKTIFRSPLQPDMMPLKNTTINLLNLENCEYPAVTNRLVIFRSHLEHMVEKGTNVEDRISLAFNFV
jgi:uncharacterized protein (TIGR02466 family)